jgi:hypothetical protein
VSKRRGIRSIGLPFSAALDKCKKTARRYWRFASGIVWSIAARLRHDQFEVARPANVSPPLEIDFCHRRMDLEEFIEVLSIGDRVRLLCDDGVVVAEKISQTQFKLIHCQMMSELVH